MMTKALNISRVAGRDTALLEEAGPDGASAGERVDTNLRAIPGGQGDGAPTAEAGGARRAEAPAAPVQAPTIVAEPQPAPKRSLRKPVAIAVVAVLVTASTWYGYGWWSEGRFMVSTDDAYVGADTSIIAPKISGYVKAVPVDNNAAVTAGTPLLLIDDADYSVALKQAEAQVSAEAATVARIEEQIAAGNAQVRQAEAELTSAQALATNANVTSERATALAGRKVGTQQAADDARAALLQANAGVEAARAGVNTAEANVAVLQAQKTEAERVLDQYKLVVAKAQLDMDHTVVRAPFDGVIGNKAAEPGEYVEPGERLMALVPLKSVYVDANFKETQLQDLRPGQRATISVDAYPDRPIEGTVESVAPASGSVFSLLPPDNATGNFTKVVQRVPVRIRVPTDVAAESLIRPGMSVVIAVDTRSGATNVAAR